MGEGEAGADFDAGGDVEVLEGVLAGDDEGGDLEGAEGFEEAAVVTVCGAHGQEEGFLGFLGVGGGDGAALEGDEPEAFDWQAEPIGVALAFAAGVDDEAVDGGEALASQGALGAAVEAAEIEVVSQDWGPAPREPFAQAEDGRGLREKGDES
jgi:hypothetical protein